MIDLHERFRSELDEVPVPDLWNRIEYLAETETVMVRPERSWVFVAVAAAVAALVLIGGPLLLLASANQEEPVADTTTVPQPAPELVRVEWFRVPHDDAVFGGEGGAEMLSIATNGSGFVAVGLTGDGVGDWRGDRNAAAWTSPDGISWSRVPHDPDIFGDAGEQEMFSVAAAGPGYVAVGYRFDEPERLGVTAGLWISPDGVEWISIRNDAEGSPMASSLADVTAGGPGVVAIGSDGNAAVWTSVDGLAWSRVPDDPDVFVRSEMSSVIVGGPGLVAVGKSRSYPGSQSTDGVTWTHSPGSSHAIVWTSVDGYTWSRVPHDEAVFGGASGEHCRMEDVTVGDSGLVAVGACEGYTVESDGEDGLVSHGDRIVIWTSENGYVWSRVPDEMVFAPDSNIDPDQSAYLDLYAIDGGLIAFDPDGTWFSSDGYAWTRTSDHTMDGGVADVTTTRTGLVAVGGDDDMTSAAVWIADRTQ